EFARDHAGESRGMTAVLVEEARTFMEPRLQSMSPAAVILAGGAAAAAQHGAQSAFEQAKPAPGSARGPSESAQRAAPTGPEDARPAVNRHSPRPRPESRVTRTVPRSKTQLLVAVEETVAAMPAAGARIFAAATRRSNGRGAVAAAAAATGDRGRGVGRRAV